MLSLFFFLIVLSFAYLFLNKMDDALSFRNKIPNTYHKFGSKTKNKQKIRPVKKNHYLESSLFKMKPDIKFFFIA